MKSVFLNCARTGPFFSYQFYGLHHGKLVEVGAEESNPEERRLLSERRQSLLDDVGGLVLALNRMLVRTGKIDATLKDKPYIKVRDEGSLVKFLAGWQSV